MAGLASSCTDFADGFSSKVVIDKLCNGDLVLETPARAIFTSGAPGRDHRIWPENPRRASKVTTRCTTLKDMVTAWNRRVAGRSRADFVAWKVLPDKLTSLEQQSNGACASLALGR